ncbi:MAG: sulfatase-like hydrolase/transferase [Verrucomicrobia bacterium]|nr:sulfatase-like hydrolase/transferase [Verrucomicrobiota bacterium]
MKKSSFALSLVVYVVSLLGLSAADEPPNVLYIFTDDQSVRTLSCYPQSFDWVRTPNIDRLASQGVRFSRAYMGSWCLPSRLIALTGKYAFTAESMRMVGPYPGCEYDYRQLPFWPSYFRKNGYTTAQIGKWHTGTDTGFGRDWDYQVVWNRPRHLDNIWNYYFDQKIEVNGAPAIMIPGYSTDNYTNWAVDYIKGQTREEGKPWYLWLCFGATHSDYEPAHRHRGEYADVEVPVPADIYPPRPGKPKYMQDYIYWKEGKSGQPEITNRQGIYSNTLKDMVRQYHQTALGIDEAVGRLMAVLEETGQRENTLVVFSSDQGIAWGQHGFQIKLAPYDANILAPLIVSMPSRFKSGTVVAPAVSHPDVVRTIFSVVDMELPWEMDGHDLTPLLKDPNAEWNHPALVSYTTLKWGSDTETIPTEPENLFGGNGTVPWYVMYTRGDRYKYVRTMVKGDMEQLYDIKTDPEELTNLALSPKYRDQLIKMRKATVAELKRTNAPFLDAMPEVE